GVDASAGANAAVAASARSGPHPLSPSPFGRGGTRRLILVLEAGDVGTAVAPQLSLDPVHRGAVSVRALAAVTELGETLDRRLVLLEVEPRDELGNGIRALCGGDGGGEACREQHDHGSAHELPLDSRMWDDQCLRNHDVYADVAVHQLGDADIAGDAHQS